VFESPRARLAFPSVESRKSASCALFSLKTPFSLNTRFSVVFSAQLDINSTVVAAIQEASAVAGFLFFKANKGRH